MATTYRFYKEGETDFYIDTDASDSHKTFFVTDVRGLDPVEIRNIFEPQIKSYNEGDFIQYAKDRKISLYSFDANRKSRCLVLQVEATPAGRFNGTTSKLVFNPGFAVATAGVYDLPIEIEMTVRLTQEDIDYQVAYGDPLILFSNNQAGDNKLSFFYFVETAIGDPFLVFQLNANDLLPGSRSKTTRIEYREIPTDTCLTIKIRIEYVDPASPSKGVNLCLNVNGDETCTLIKGTNSGINPNVWELFFGTISLGYSYFKGIMRTLKMSVGGTQVLDCPDPSTGVNSLGLNGTPTDIEQVNVII